MCAIGREEKLKNLQKDESTEHKILVAARQEFIENGLRGARMKAIADAAEVNKALIHYYFRSKQKLYESVIENILSQVWGAIRENLQQMDDPDDLRGQIHSIVTTATHVLRSNPDFPRFMAREMAEGGKVIPTIVERFMQAYGDVAAKLLSAIAIGVAKGEVKKIEPIHIIMNLISMTVVGFIFSPVFTSVSRNVLGTELTVDDEFFEKRIHAVTETACTGIFTGGAA